MYIIPLKVGQDDYTDIQEKVHNMLVAEGGKITQEENLGKRKLAYPIANVRHGTYVVNRFDLESDKVKKVEDWLRLSNDIIRHQLIAVKIKTPEQLAREQALQEKLMKKQLKAETAARNDDSAKPTAPTAKTTMEPAELADLDKKLEAILEQEIVK